MIGIEKVNVIKHLGRHLGRVNDIGQVLEHRMFHVLWSGKPVVV